MADSNNNNDEQRSTDSNLPILFANGYPTSLEKMTKDQLERFIPFLIKCSRTGSEDDNETPKWWPVTVKFQMPLVKPKKYKKVKKCFMNDEPLKSGKKMLFSTLGTFSKNNLLSQILNCFFFGLFFNSKVYF